MNGNDGPLLTYYGDDFTGSTDVLEALVGAGIRTLLFLEPPTTETLSAFGRVDAVGVAGGSRAMTPDQMDKELPSVFARLRKLGAPILHYKTCSTFDSSPEIGSIGRAIDLGQALPGSPVVPLVVGAPALGRYCAFGNLFARSGLESEPYRLDRHPAMRRHPMTPMRESDLRVHLSKQTEQRVGLVSLLDLADRDLAARRYAARRDEGSGVVLFDVISEDHLATIGEVLWREAEAHPPLFVAGSSGVEYALTAHWRAVGDAGDPAAFGPVEPLERLVVVSGSCSPVTDRQIDRALNDGFLEVPLAPDRLVDPDAAPAEIDRGVRAALQAIERGRSVIVHTCRGPRDRRIRSTTARLTALGYAKVDGKVASARLLGEALGEIARRAIERGGSRRAVVVGGDTSVHVARRLGIEALEMIAPVAPGSPLCRVGAPDKPLDGLEVIFKGGQVGTVDFFGRARGDPRQATDP